MHPKALYLTFNVGFMSPTRELLLLALQKTTDLTLFGPGYSPLSIIEEGVERFVEKHGPFDFVITDEYVLQNFDMEHPEKNRFVNHSCPFDRGLLFQAVRWRDFLKDYTGKRIICLMQSDYYNFPQTHIDRLSEVGDYYITWGQEIIPMKSEVPPGEIPGGISSDPPADKWSDNYYNFTIDNQARIISTPQFIAHDEGSDRRLADRPLDWSCLGADYNARIIARKILDEANFRRPGQWMPRAFSIAGKLNFNMYNKYWTINIIRRGFRHALRQARYSFTCGSYLRWPIRKFFEIPVNGAVLVCQSPKGLQDLGFIPGKSVVTVDAKDILDAHAWLEKDPDRAQDIADAGRQLVLEKHSVEARADQIGSALRAIMDRCYHGSQWKDGNFCLRSQDKH